MQIESLCIVVSCISVIVHLSRTDVLSELRVQIVCEAEFLAVNISPILIYSCNPRFSLQMIIQLLLLPLMY